MKFSLLFTTAFFSFVVGHHGAFSQSSNRYDIEKISIDYEIKGDAEGSAKRLIAEYGWKEKYSYSYSYELYGIKSNQNKLELRRTNDLYKVDFNAKKGKSSKDELTPKLIAYKNTRDTQEAIFTQNGGSVSGEAVHLGKTVTKWTFSKGAKLEVWEWDGIVLYEKRKLAGIVFEIVATKIEENPQIDSQYDFTVPKSVEFD